MDWNGAVMVSRHRQDKTRWQTNSYSWKNEKSFSVCWFWGFFKTFATSAEFKVRC